MFTILSSLFIICYWMDGCMDDKQTKHTYIHNTIVHVYIEVPPSPKKRISEHCIGGNLIGRSKRPRRGKTKISQFKGPCCHGHYYGYWSLTLLALSGE